MLFGPGGLSDYVHALHNVGSLCLNVVDAVKPDFERGVQTSDSAR